MLFDPWAISTYFVILTMATLVVGFARDLLGRNGAIFHLVLCIVLVFLAYIARSTYWDFDFLRIIPFGDGDGRIVNVVFDLIACWGALHGHRALYLLIPEEDRAKWHTLTAWMYPPSTLFPRFISKGIKWPR